ncbi:MAG: hypothetical protein HON53_00635 [Planctomycetaceae bacterium]|jgi:type II secretory pathway pseudopilin PulG|nr:hypothetical protein [Planctomycetaceae bacterium]MBT6155811.1 hypothetical protein [Planctomycetaceae bacterium]MBT6484947.1 hypothetical protein [Planctomycetaceae bacterium]MBT6495426.1 hypothetical protein [Planctomycetaceae bacterium]
MKNRRIQSTEPNNRRGLSLIEVVVSTLLVGLVLVTSMKTVGGVIRTWQVSEEQHDGMALAVELMTEVLQARYIEEGGSDKFLELETGESATDRSAWDDTDDYDDWSASPPKSKDNTSLTDYTGWTRAINVQKVHSNDPTSALNDNADDQGLRKITITVTAPDSTQTVLVGLRARDGVMEQAPSVDSTFVMHVGSDLQVGTGTDAVRSGANITNHAKDQ